MNLNDSPDQARFRAEVRNWIKNSVPAEFKALKQGIVQAPELTEEKMSASLRKVQGLGQFN